MKTFNLRSLILITLWILGDDVYGASLKKCTSCGAFSNGTPQGWLWYQEKLPQAKENFKNTLKPPLPSQETLPRQDPVSQVEIIKKEFEKATALAILEPTFQNVLSAQHLQRAIMDRADAFSKMWEWVTLWDHRNFRMEGQGSPIHREILKKETHKKLSENLKTLSKTFGLFFVFKEDCPYCHAFAPIVYEFSVLYGFAVKAISKEGTSLKEFPNASKDNGAIQKLNPQGIFPALFLVDPLSETVIPLSWGMSSLSTLAQHASLIFEERKKPS